MNVSWILRSKEQLCEWTFSAPMFRFSVGQDINEFFSLVEGLNAAWNAAGVAAGDAARAAAGAAERGWQFKRFMEVLSK